MHSIIALFAAGLFAGNVTFGVLSPWNAVAGADPEEPPETVQDVNEQARAAASLERRNEILWLARVLYSETKIPEEMRLVGWVVRNRVETSLRGRTYRQVATSEKQFSGLTPGEAGYETIINLDYEDTRNHSWVTALAIAEEIYDADSSSRPFPSTVRHFYSPHAVSATPAWVDAGILHLQIEAPDGSHSRFAFYKGIK
ncbi:MAG: cell wall hydrolase [bacterium]|nr:cell wall hydrolase [bacterium]MDZ4285133.1 cell wall hydrolase [Patescibacteria group bacterium]